jgi:hypothetical protein
MSGGPAASEQLHSPMHSTKMRILTASRFAAQNLARLAAAALGVELAMLHPIGLAIEARRAANAAAGYAPNMDPGVVAVLAAVLAAPILIALFLIEITRCWFKGHKPLAYPSYLALGVLAVWPIGLNYSVPEIQLRYSAMAACSALGVAAFYGARWLWLSWRPMNARRNLPRIDP